MRAVVVPLDVSASEERLLVSYCGARRFAFNWVLGLVKENLEVRRRERESGVAWADLTPAVTWSAQRLGVLWNSVKDEVAPWWREVSMHAFRSGIVDAAAALKNWSDSKSGRRRGRRVGFPGFKRRGRSTPSVSFVEIKHQLSWLHPDRHHVRLMLPQASPDPDVRRRRHQLKWLHTTESTRRLYRLVEADRASIQKVTISRRGGRWQASFLVRYQVAPAPKPVRHRGGLVGVDAGVKHLVTTSEPVPGLTDLDGHVASPAVLEGHLRRLRRLDRAIARCQEGSRNRRKLVARRARLHGRVTKTRALYLHRITSVLAGAYDVVAVEDLNVAGMTHRKRRLGRRLADASLGELRRQLTYKTADRGHEVVPVGRFFPSSKTCSGCGAVKAKLALAERTYRCDECGLIADRDVNAARTIAREARRLLGQPDPQETSGTGRTSRLSPGYDRRRKTLTGDHVSPGRPSRAWQRSLDGRTKQPPPAERVGACDLDGTPATAPGSTD